MQKVLRLYLRVALTKMLMNVVLSLIIIPVKSSEQPFQTKL